MAMLQPPSSGAPLSPPGARANSGSKRPLVIVVAIVALLLIVGALSQLVRPTPSPEPAATATARPTATPTLVPPPLPPPPSTPSPSSIEAAASVRPQTLWSPQLYYQPPTFGWEVVGTEMVAPISSGIFYSYSTPNYSAFSYGPAGLVRATCSTHDGENIWLSGLSRDGDLTTWSFDVQDRWWDRVGETIPVGFNDCSTRVIDNQIVIASSTTTGIHFLSRSRTGNTLWQHHLDYPSDWLGDPVNFASVTRLLVDGDEVVADLCVRIQGDAECAHHYLRFDFTGLQSNLTWDETFLGVIEPSDLYVGPRSAAFAGNGLQDDAIEIVEVAEEIWQLERHQFNSDEVADIWSVVPFRLDPVRFPPDRRPELFAFEGSVAAAVTCQRPSLSTEGQTLSDNACADGFEWWLYNRESATWNRSDDVPVRAIDSSTTLFETAGRTSGLLRSAAGNWSVVLSTSQ